MQRPEFPPDYSMAEVEILYEMATDYTDKAQLVNWPKISLYVQQKSAMSIVASCVKSLFFSHTSSFFHLVPLFY